MPARAAELAKLATNAHLALRVIWAEQLYDLCMVVGVDYEIVREAVAADPRIGASHLQVWHGGYRGYGGACLPKDVPALIDYARQMGAPLTVQEATHLANQRLQTDSFTSSVDQAAG